jgi:predicted nucleic acid-binding protein
VIVVDTSVWVAATREPAAGIAHTLRKLIGVDEAVLALPVRIELLAGIARKDRAAFTRALSALPVVFPSEDTWRILQGWIEPAADAGHRFAVTDLLIAALAHEIDALIWSLDADFARMEGLRLVRLYAPTSSAGPISGQA